MRQMIAKRSVLAPVSNDYEPIEFNSLVNQHRVEIETDVFSLYTLMKQSSGDDETNNSNDMIILFIHGGGLSSASWFPCWKHIQQQLSVNNKPQLYEFCAVDLRDHGQTETIDSDLSMSRLVSDVVAVMNKRYNSNETQKRDLILVGHSLGGAIAIRSVDTLSKHFSIKGLVVMDLVEGSALSNLPYMKKTIENRPTVFPSLAHAIKWTVSNGIIRNLDSARVSVPSQLKASENGQYTWRTQLEKTQTHWTEWFTGLSASFLGVNAPKMLFVANTDRLDQLLVVGQMQGKFQLKILPGNHIGHFIHEDAPKETAETLLVFINRVNMLRRL